MLRNDVVIGKDTHVDAVDEIGWKLINEARIALNCQNEVAGEIEDKLARDIDDWYKQDLIEVEESAPVEYFPTNIACVIAEPLVRHKQLITALLSRGKMTKAIATHINDYTKHVRYSNEWFVDINDMLCIELAQKCPIVRSRGQSSTSLRWKLSDSLVWAERIIVPAFTELFDRIIFGNTSKFPNLVLTTDCYPFTAYTERLVISATNLDPNMYTITQVSGYTMVSPIGRPDLMGKLVNSSKLLATTLIDIRSIFKMILYNTPLSTIIASSLMDEGVPRMSQGIRAALTKIYETYVKLYDGKYFDPHISYSNAIMAVGVSMMIIKGVGDKFDNGYTRKVRDYTFNIGQLVIESHSTYRVLVTQYYAHINRLVSQSRTERPYLMIVDKLLNCGELLVVFVPEQRKDGSVVFRGRGYVGRVALYNALAATANIMYWIGMKWAPIDNLAEFCKFAMGVINQ